MKGHHHRQPMSPDNLTQAGAEHRALKDRESAASRLVGHYRSLAHGLIPSAQRFVWAAKQPLGNAALGALFA